MCHAHNKKWNKTNKGMIRTLGEKKNHIYFGILEVDTINRDEKKKTTKNKKLTGTLDEWEKSSK